ncbi:hypothetical protein J2S55_007378 [Streptosporangium brasiliense]|uniref:Uncharacterized protein n=1 Tax=Streptosporangium brasiliense TaxID=47480 RepID=A0ABT9RFS2_9ACTN|nr:hypothetical protein [Streptosporangium brasiliense]
MPRAALDPDGPVIQGPIPSPSGDRPATSAESASTTP